MVQTQRDIHWPPLHFSGFHEDLLKSASGHSWDVVPAQTGGEQKTNDMNRWVTSILLRSTQWPVESRPGRGLRKYKGQDRKKSTTLGQQAKQLVMALEAHPVLRALSYENSWLCTSSALGIWALKWPNFLEATTMIMQTALHPTPPCSSSRCPLPRIP